MQAKQHLKLLLIISKELSLSLSLSLSLTLSLSFSISLSPFRSLLPHPNEFCEKLCKMSNISSSPPPQPSSAVAWCNISVSPRLPFISPLPPFLSLSPSLYLSPLFLHLSNPHLFHPPIHNQCTVGLIKYLRVWQWMNTNSKIYYFLQKKFFAVFISASVCPTKRREKEESLALTD